MIDEILEMIMKEARARPGKDLILSIYSVLMDIHLRILPAMEAIRQDERRNKDHER